MTLTNALKLIIAIKPLQNHLFVVNLQSHTLSTIGRDGLKKTRLLKDGATFVFQDPIAFRVGTIGQGRGRGKGHGDPADLGLQAFQNGQHLSLLRGAGIKRNGLAFRGVARSEYRGR